MIKLFLVAWTMLQPPAYAENRIGVAAQPIALPSMRPDVQPIELGDPSAIVRRHRFRT